MPTPHPPRPPFSRPPRPATGRPPRPTAPGESDESLAARLRRHPEGDEPHPVALLMARHWQSVHDYAVICLASSGQLASMVTAASFHRLVRQLTRGGSGAAVRPLLLVTVRDTVKQWAGEERISGVLPDLRKPAGGRGMRAAQTMTPENRRLAEHAFSQLPGLVQCLLWHTEVEAEPISVPAGLSGLDAGTASAALEQAHEQFRAALVRAHQELAPTKECRYNNRLLDVPIRRGGALLPDVQRHLLECRYCADAAEQLSQVENDLDTMLAEAVLGWGARRYLDSRPDRAKRAARDRTTTPRGTARVRAAAARAAGVRAAGSGRHRLLPRFPTPARWAPPGHSLPRSVVTGVGIASAAALVSLLTVALWSDDGGADPTASTSATGSRTATSPGPGLPAGGASPSVVTPQQTRLRNIAVGQCLDIRGGRAEQGSGARLAECSSAQTQQWSYEQDGLLRSVAAPELCLDSRADASGLVVLGRCVAASADRADDVRYDLTVQGELLPRWTKELAVTPAAADPKADVVSKDRDGSDVQRWATDAPSASPDSLSIAGTARPPSSPAPAASPSAGAPGDDFTDVSAGPDERTGERNGERRAVTVDIPDTGAPSPLPAVSTGAIL
ncbi:RICIN domain-containing protein [Streptomyces sp. NPDC059786]|uniref:RICIN domain-containing protein n=1 Tax=Streptomyces sp. NPDC059786 TaxID=3346946 RepID=UPI00365801F0